MPPVPLPPDVRPLVPDDVPEPAAGAVLVKEEPVVLVFLTVGLVLCGALACVASGRTTLGAATPPPMPGVTAWGSGAKAMATRLVTVTVDSATSATVGPPARAARARARRAPAREASGPSCWTAMVIAPDQPFCCDDVLDRLIADAPRPAMT